jgi:hypothetical protein
MTKKLQALPSKLQALPSKPQAQTSAPSLAILSPPKHPESAQTEETDTLSPLKDAWSNHLFQKI